MAGKTRWTVDPMTFSEVIKDHVKEKAGLLALAIHDNLVMATPVDTGRARSNWMPSVGAPDTSTTTATSAESTKSAAASMFDAANLPENPKLYISNSLDYIQALNNGHSKQAPSDFISIAIMDGKARVGL